MLKNCNILGINRTQKPGMKKRQKDEPRRSRIVTIKQEISQNGYCDMEQNICHNAGKQMESHIHQASSGLYVSIAVKKR